jgi:hypothetical protein
MALNKLGQERQKILFLTPPASFFCIILWQAGDKGSSVYIAPLVYDLIKGIDFPFQEGDDLGMPAPALHLSQLRKLPDCECSLYKK